MAKYSTESIRNVAVTGHGGSGKTTLVEALLHRAGAISAPGAVEKGTTTCDFDPEEKAHQHSLSSALAHLDHDGVHLNLIDTPGMPEFVGYALAALPAAETAAVVVNAANGIEMLTRRMMDRAAEQKLCRLIVINRIDSENLDLPGLLQQIRDTFGNVCLPVNLPTGGGSDVIDVFSGTEGDADFSSVAEAHTAIVDQVVEVDERLMEKYLEQGEVSADELHDPFEKALREGHLVPICFTSAKTGAGIDALLEILTKMMPNPTEANPHPFVRGEGEAAEAFECTPDPAAPVIAHVFKVTTDPFVGKLGVFRIHQGTITKDTQLLINDAKKPFRVGHLFKLQGKDTTEIDTGVPGDLCAVAKVDEISFGAALHDSADHGGIRAKAPVFPVPMSGFAIQPKSRGDEQKISKAIHALEVEDPCVLIGRGEETVLRGMGDLHLRVILEKMKNRYGIEVDTKPPKIAYRETVQAKGEAQYRHKKQTGGAGQFGEVHLRVEPTEAGTGFEFSNDIFGGSIPGQFIPAVEKGVRQMLTEGCVAGYPIQDIKVSVYDGKHHPVDSKEVAFVAASRNAFKLAVQNAKPAILEPIVDMEITVPENNMGDIAGDLSGKRGRIQGTDTIPGGMVLIKAQAPLAELGQYQNQLKSVTGGQGSFSMELSHYEAVPANVQQQLVSAYKPRPDDD